MNQRRVGETERSGGIRKQRPGPGSRIARVLSASADGNASVNATVNASTDATLNASINATV